MWAKMPEPHQAPLVNWDLPYGEGTITWSSQDSPVGVVALDKPGKNLFDTAWKAAVVEAPEGVWCAWSLQAGTPVAWAPTFPNPNTNTEVFAEFSMHQMKRVCPPVM